MGKWNANLYLTFEAQRSQPALDLANRLKDSHPQNIIDIGCGPGNSTAILYSLFPNTKIMGIDSSQEMIDSAKTHYPHIFFYLCDVYEIDGKYDLIFANASLQWIPNYHILLPFLLERLNSNGTLAVQMPNNSNEPLYRVIEMMIANPKWGFNHLEIETNETLPFQRYFEILSQFTSKFEVWESIYYHPMPSHYSLVEWVKSTKLRPYFNALNDEAKAEFESELLAAIAPFYIPINMSFVGSREGDSTLQNPLLTNSVLLQFKRLFFIAKAM
ncbi:methyltransferase domain-containing protein [Helicobacter didelphidarum]|uniref:methyltransferase domain-containing protein n=1 Tax=Helicobacter didelphidarum TaxID=2040648 RepID=UPI0015F16591|nr:methyltransferase domain-containing protein [Helicobacter didelphidarum]